MKELGNTHFIIPIFVPHLGCPHDCIFCNQKKITGLSTNINKVHVKETIEAYLKTFPQGDITVEVAFYGGSFTGIDKSIQRKLLSIPYQYKNKGIINGIRLSTRPDYIDQEILDLLQGFGVDTIELGVQSLCQEVLDKSYRGHSVEEVYKGAGLIKEYGFNLGLQMMIGLAGDNKERSIFTAKEFIKLDPYCVRIYPTLVIKGTYLARLFKENKYTPLSMEDAVALATDILLLFEHNNINVIRIGLQPTDNIQLGQDVIAGPFHPSFRQLVEGNIYKLILDEYLSKHNREAIKNKILLIETHNKNISNIVGQKAINKSYLVDKYNLGGMKIKATTMDEDKIKLNVNNIEDTISLKEGIKKLLQLKGIL